MVIPLHPVDSPYIHDNAYENIVCEMATILSLGSIKEYNARIF